NDQLLRRFISEAFKEDVGDGDHSTLGSVPEHLQEEAELWVKADCVLAGVELAIEICKFDDSERQVDVLMQECRQARIGGLAMRVRCSARSILTSERLVLNCMQRMSGIATLAHQMVKAGEGTCVRILDTRKPTPNFRMCEKWAVYIGGAYNHRY